MSSLICRHPIRCFCWNFLLEPYHRSLGKRISKTPKLYFTDSGLAAYLVGVASADALWSSREAGAFWENHVVCQWLRWRDWHEPSLGLWYWRHQGGNEVDLILERDRKLVAVECKLKEKPQEKVIQRIRKLKKFYRQDEVAKAYVAIPTDLSFEVEPGITAVSGWEVWPLEHRLGPKKE